jgi:hypothetical protein
MYVYVENTPKARGTNSACKNNNIDDGDHTYTGYIMMIRMGGGGTQLAKPPV